MGDLHKGLRGQSIFDSFGCEFGFIALWPSYSKFQVQMVSLVQVILLYIKIKGFHFKLFPFY